MKGRIIRATNSQTSLGLSSLRAMDRVQREIEEYFRTKSRYYQRRKNFYHNRQIPLQNLVSIDQLGQAVMATLVQVPHILRGEVSRIVQDDVYDVVFARENPIAMYLPAIQIVRKCELYLRNNRQTQGQVDNFARVARATNEVLFDKVAKDPGTAKALRDRMSRYLASSRRP